MLVTHAMQRAMERCPGVCPGLLLRGLKASILERDGKFARFVAHCRKDPFKDIYIFRTANGLTRYCIATSPTGFIVTILYPGHEIWTSRGRFMLGENGLEALE